MDAAGTAAGFGLALVGLGTVRELVGTGALLANMDRLFGEVAAGWQLTLTEGGLAIASLPPGAFIIAGLLLAAGQAYVGRQRGQLREPASDTDRT